ncbi:MAG: bifunctional adenosylcobinamide kinase/adenosylcobinamide-phosphate guanylyltransferase [Lachnospiraceae bacterium]|nr:bifunctional adenosylcobinamide kinase/adenosylcobinamide-phosphate guanylyltransferase [Lachnospiraceae bacterium]
MILITGGSGSGKSAFAEQMACSLHESCNRGNLIYLATMEAYGEEGAQRVRRHRKLRAGKGFLTIEKTSHLQELMFKQTDTVLLECVSNLTANEMFTKERFVPEVCDKVTEQIGTITKQCKNLVVVTNDVFGDGTDYSRETVIYMEQLGKINCELAKKAEKIYEVVYGIPICVFDADDTPDNRTDEG